MHSYLSGAHFKQILKTRLNGVWRISTNLSSNVIKAMSWADILGQYSGCHIAFVPLWHLCSAAVIGRWEIQWEELQPANHFKTLPIQLIINLTLLLWGKTVPMSVNSLYKIIVRIKFNKNKTCIWKTLIIFFEFKVYGTVILVSRHSYSFLLISYKLYIFFFIKISFHFHFRLKNIFRFLFLS